ncbi:MAG: thioredoxin domain-containing protein, partial [Chlamydiia bacterium]|nr:thioredoxin domain-containing protein [Chlamydiia bacterium]
YDHLGGGFSRYSVDDKWLVPHFEKMLYDNAILGGAYLDAYRLTGKNNYRVICIEILEYILREMSHPKGGFYSAEDAETDGVEGAFYLWTKKEVFSLLPSQEATLFCEYYDVTEEGNFEGKNILHPVYPLEEFVDYKGIDQEMVEQSLKRSRAILFEARATRKRPFKDDKILTSWNALMIDTLARCGFAFGEKRFIDAARLAAEFIRENLWKEGKLLRRYREGATDYEGSLDDYVFMIRALITLYEGGLGEKYLEWAIEMAHLLEREFKADEGAFYLTGPNHSILLRRCELYDSSLPSGNAVHAENLIRLYQITYHRDFWIQAEDILKVARAFLEAFAQGACYHLLSMHRYFNKQLPNLVIALKDKEEGKAELQKHLFSRLYPHLAFSWKEGESEYPLKEGKTTFYLCIHGKCQPPLTDWDALEKALESLN